MKKMPGVNRIARPVSACWQGGLFDLYKMFMPELYGSQNNLPISFVTNLVIIRKEAAQTCKKDRLCVQGRSGYVG